MTGNILSTLKSFLGTRSKGADASHAARMEAFVSAFPGDYCGWAADGSVVYSPGFCKTLGIDSLKSFDDIQAALMPGDAAALEGLFERLCANGVSFTLPIRLYDDSKTLRISGTAGRDSAGIAPMHILWLEDRTEDGNALRETSGKTLEAEEELARLRAALDTVPRPLWLRNAEQAIIWCNETYATFLGKSRDSIVEEQKEILSQQRKSKAAPHLPAPGPEMAADALQTGEIRETRGHSIIQGRRMLLNISEIPMPAYGMTLGIAYNVTREEDLENELKRHQSSNRELLEQLRSAIAIYGADERLEFYNSSYAQLWGLEDQWLNTRPRLGEIMEKLRETRRLPEQADFRRFKQSWRDMFTRLIDPFEDMLYLPDGTVLRMLAVPHSMGGLMMTFEDVTSRLELESSYNTLIAVQKETLDNLDEAIAVYGGDGRLKLWNPAFATLWKFNPESLSGEPHITTVVEKQKPFFEEKTWPRQKEDLIAKGLERRMQEGRLHRTNDTLVDYVTVPIPDGGVLISYRDVTDTVRVENALREKNAALEAAEQLKVDFLANVSYQLRTPLNAIMGFNEILGKEFFGPLNERQKQYTQDIQTASDRLLTLINDILDLATLEAGYMALDRSDVNIHSMLQGVRDLVEEWARKDQISLEIACPETIGAVYADERRLRQALINLVRNAITFTPAGGTIRIAATRSHAGFTITVSDTGVGISREDRMRIFEPFERAHSAVGNMRLSRSGAGLGLALVKNIIALHGGTVDLESEPGKGTAVSLFLPLTAVPTMLKLSVPVSGEESV